MLLRWEAPKVAARLLRVLDVRTRWALVNKYVGVYAAEVIIASSRKPQQERALATRSTHDSQPFPWARCRTVSDHRVMAPGSMSASRTAMLSPAIDTLTNNVIGTTAIGQAPAALIYVPNAVPSGDGLKNLEPLGVSGEATHLTMAAAGAQHGTAPTTVTLFNQGLIQVLGAAVALAAAALRSGSLHEAGWQRPGATAGDLHDQPSRSDDRQRHRTDPADRRE